MLAESFHKVLKKTFHFRSCRLEVLCKKSVLRNFAKLTGNTCVRVSFFNKVEDLQLYLKRDSGTGVFL